MFVFSFFAEANIFFTKCVTAIVTAPEYLSQNEHFYLSSLYYPRKCTHLHNNFTTTAPIFGRILLETCKFQRIATAAA